MTKNPKFYVVTPCGAGAESRVGFASKTEALRFVSSLLKSGAVAVQIINVKGGK